MISTGLNLGLRIVFILLLFSACLSVLHAQSTMKSWKTRSAENKINETLKRYDDFILHTNPDSIASLYAPDGNLGDIAIGRDSIRKFLLKFQGIKVLAVHTQSTSLKIEGKEAHQTGEYNQRAILPKGDTVQVKGKIDILWTERKPGSWYIQKMKTTP